MKSATTKTGSISWTLRLFTLLVWLFVALCTAYWAFKFVTNKPVEANAAAVAPAIVVDSKAVAKLLGASDNIAPRVANTSANTKFSLFGLVSSDSGHGVALIAIDGKPAKPYRVGSMVADDLMLKSIAKTSVTLAASLKAPDSLTLELPARKPASMVATTPNLGNSGSANPTVAPAINTAAVPQVPPVAPMVSPVAPNAVMPNMAAAGFTGAAGAMAAAGLSDRAAAISRFTAPAGDAASVRQPLAGSGSATAER